MVLDGIKTMNEVLQNVKIDFDGGEAEPTYLAQKVLEKSTYEGDHRYFRYKCCTAYRTYSIDAEECSISFYSSNKSQKTIALQGNLLLIPLVDKNDNLHGFQAIDENGNKAYQKGIAKSGLFHALYDLSKLGGEYCDEIFIAEGYATGSTLMHVSGKPVIIALDAGNLKDVVKIIYDRFPTALIIIAADFDKSKAGQRAASDAARQVPGCKVTWPKFTEEELDCENPPSDFNDLNLIKGADQVLKNLYEFVDVFDVLESDVHFVKASSIEPTAIYWLWEYWLAIGKLHILAGEPGTGKTTIAMAVAAVVSTGGNWPDGTTSEVGKVLIWSGEDDPQDTLVPRLKATGGNLDNIIFIGDAERPFDPARDIPKLKDAAYSIGNVKLVILDPIVNAIQGDSHKNVEVRKALQPIVELGSKLDAAIVGITHFTKATQGRNPLDRVTGSLAFGALARMVWVATRPHEQQKADFILVRAKSNISKDEGGFLYDIEETNIEYPAGSINTSRISWEGEIEGTASELLGGALSAGKISKVEEVANRISELLYTGPMEAEKILGTLKKEGFKKSTIDRAKDRLKIISDKDKKFKGIWYWMMPSKNPNLIKDPHK